jgi:hypothetical protein
MTMETWFERLLGFPEKSPEFVRVNTRLDGPFLESQVNGRRIRYGNLEIPTLCELSAQVSSIPPNLKPTTVREIIGDVRDLHADPENANALFQVASQFNLLEMVSPFVTPDQGVGRYENDHTQGPACAVSAGAGTIFRNYWVPVNGQTGQTVGHQIDCLSDVGIALGNTDRKLWKMTNGYALPTLEGLSEIASQLAKLNESEWDDLRCKLRIGLQWQTQVTLPGCTHWVSQAYCSALPVAYAPHPLKLWEPFARLILEAAYEATLCAAIQNAELTGCRRVFLTQLGGGAFGNEPDWILDALVRALDKFHQSGLEVSVVSYGWSDPLLRKRLQKRTL